MEPTPTSPRSVLAIVAGPFASAAALGLLGRMRSAGLLVIVALVAAHLELLAPQVLRRAEAALATTVRAVRLSLEAALGAVVFALVIIPGWVVHRLQGHSLNPDAGWVERIGPSSTAGRPTRPFATPSRSDRPPGKLAKGFAVMGAIASIVVVDVTAGTVWQRRDPEVPSASAQPAIRVDFLAASSGTPSNSKIASEPWGPTYLRSLGSLRQEYWPYLLLRTRPLEAPYIHTDGWERTTATSSSDAGDRPSVWLFGGSVAWGLGQRDEHTIASELSALAADDDLPLDAHNFGQIGWVTEQEVDLFDLLLEHPDTVPPALAVFLDGAGDVAAQAQTLEGGKTPTSPVPIHLGLDNALESVRAAAQATEPVAQPNPSLAQETWDAYKRASLAARVWRALAGEPAEAQEVGSCRACGSLWHVDRIDADDGDRAAAVYESQRRRAIEVAKRSGVQASFIWQPTRRDIPVVRETAAAVSTPTVDLSAALDTSPESFLDGIHVDEAGARVIAQRIYEHIRPGLETWYAAHR